MMIKTLLSVLALMAATTQPLLAQSARDVPAQGEILPGWQQADGTRIAAIRIQMAPGWKTYWRAPGDAGIPPRFDWSRSSNLRGDVRIIWPMPSIHKQNGMRTIGYEGDLILPIALAPRRPGKPVKLRAELDIGVCKDICVPYQLSLKATLETTSQTPSPAIAAALAARPYGAAEAGVTQATCRLSPIADGMEIETRVTMPALKGTEIVVIEPGQPGVWMSETTSDRRGNVLVSVGEMVPPSGQSLLINRSDVVITVLGRTSAVEIKGCSAG